MAEKKIDKSYREYTLTKSLGMIVLMLLLMVSIAGAAPFAYVANYGSNTVSVIDTATNKVTVTIPAGSGPWGVAVNPAGTNVYVANRGNGTISVIKTASNTIEATVPIGGRPTGVAVTPDGSKVYAATAEDNGPSRAIANVSVIDTATNKVTAIVNITPATNLAGVVVSPDGTEVYVTHMKNWLYWNVNYVTVIDTFTNIVKTKVTVGKFPTSIAFNPDGTKAYVANSDQNNVSVIDIAKYATVASVNVGKVPYGVAFSPDGAHVYITNSGSTTVSVIDTATNTVKATVPVGNNPTGVSITPDGRRVYVTNSGSNNVSVIKTATNTVIASVNVGMEPYSTGQFIVPAPSKFYTISVTGTNYQYQAWGQYPLISLFGENYVPLFSNGEPIWNNHADKLSKLIMDSKDTHYITAGEKLDLGQGYSLKVNQIDVDGVKVWLELDRNGTYVDDYIVSTGNTWTCTLDNIQGVNNVPVLKVHVNQIAGNTVQIDGIWLIDYTNAKTLKIGDRLGRLSNGYILTKIINGIDPSRINGINKSFLGELVFKKSVKTIQRGHTKT